MDAGGSASHWVLSCHSAVVVWARRLVRHISVVSMVVGLIRVAISVVRKHMTRLLLSLLAISSAMRAAL